MGDEVDGSNGADAPAGGAGEPWASVAGPTAPVETETSAAELAATQALPYFDAALRRNVASFADVVQSHFYSLEGFNDDEVGRLVYQRYLEGLIGAFEQAEGGVLRTYYCSAIVAAAALTGDEKRGIRLHLINNETSPEDVDVLAVLSECERLAVRARNHLSGDELRVCADAVYSVVTNALDLLDVRVSSRRAGSAPDDAALVEYVRSELAGATELYEQGAQRNAQITYFGGMLIGTAIAAVLTLLLGLVDLAGDERHFLGSLAAGAVGGVVSVMERMTSGKLELRYETGDRFIRFLGVFRPLIGAVFGVVLYFLLAAEILPIELPGDSTEQLYFFAAVAFLAGFSERWAQDMLVVSQGAISGRAAPPEERDSTAPPPSSP